MAKHYSSCVGRRLARCSAKFGLFRRYQIDLATEQGLAAGIMSGTVERVRPERMTVAAIMAGLLPIMWSHCTGAEVMQRIVVPMVGGMVSSTVLTLVVIPAIYAIVKGVALRSPQLALSPHRT